MGISPRRAAQPASRRAHRTMFRSRVWMGSLACGLALLVVGGAALVPDAVSGGVTPLAMHEVSNRTEVTGAPASMIADSARAGERPAREPQTPRPAAVPGSVTPQALTELTVVPGVPEPCSIDLAISDDLSAADITRRAEERWGFALSGPQWRQDGYRPIVKLFAETLDSVDCTDYLNRVKVGNGGRLEISSEPTRSWAWGDYGLTRTNVLTLDFEKFRQSYAEGDRGRLVRLIIHEMAHSLNADRFGEPPYWSAYNQVWSASGPVSDYGSTATESFADAVGYYVARCAADNPYDSRSKAGYYNYVKTHIFAGREFGGPVGVPQDCVIKGR